MKGLNWETVLEMTEKRGKVRVSLIMNCTAERFDWQSMVEKAMREGNINFSLDTDTADRFGCTGTKGNNTFTFSYAPADFLILSMQRKDADLIDAFSQAIGRFPLAEYTGKSGMITVEWTKKDRDRALNRLLAMQKKRGISNLKAL